MLLVLRGACTVSDANGEARLAAGSVLVSRRSKQPTDSRIARALAQLQAEPGKRWTVEQLARSVGMSRAAFARRFAAVTGQPPLRYLADLRLALAATLLTTDEPSLAELALRVGYASEFAFSRAFKRRYGIAPGSFRRLQQGAPITMLRAAA